MLTFEGAQAAPNHSHQLIVEYKYSKICLYFCKDCRIFCEGVKDNGNAVSQRLFGLGETGLVGLIGYNGLVGRIVQNGLIDCNNLVSFIGLGASFIGGFVGFVGLGLVSIARLIGLISLGKLGITSLVGVSASSACRLIGLIGFTIRSLAMIAAAAILSVAVASQAAEATILTSATEIADVAFYYCASSSLHVCLLVREKMCWWLALARKRCGCGLPLLATPTTVMPLAKTWPLARPLATTWPMA
jgi:hypothetical protein